MRALIFATALSVLATGQAHAYCKYQKADGTWYFGDKCAQASEKEIRQDGHKVLEPHQIDSQATDRVRPAELKGYEKIGAAGNPGVPPKTDTTYDRSRSKIR